MKKTFKRIIALLSVIAIIFSFSAAAFAAEPRTSTNGYTYTTIRYNEKPYTISLAIGCDSANGVRASAHCPIGGIKITVKGVTAKFDTKYGGYITSTGDGTSGTTDGPSEHFYVNTSYMYCPNAGSYGVIRVLAASTSATFKSVNNGSDVTLYVNYHAN